MIIHAPCSVGEVIDKITVLEIKLARINDEKKLTNIREEWELLMSSLRGAIHVTDEVNELKDELMRINSSIWDSEDQVREFWDDEKKFLEAARNSHFMNDERARVKRRINELLGSSIIEEKSHPKYEHKV